MGKQPIGAVIQALLIGVRQHCGRPSDGRKLVVKGYMVLRRHVGGSRIVHKWDISCMLEGMPDVNTGPTATLPFWKRITIL
jgi:predicted ABC-class ATPase